MKKRSNWVEWFTAVKKSAIGACFLIIAVLFTFLGPREGTMGQIEYLFYVLGLISFINILFTKLAAQNINYIIFLIINGAAVSFIFAITDLATSGLFETNIANAVTVIILFILWALHSVLLKGVDFLKRLGLSFFLVVGNTFCMLLAFMLLAVLRWK